MSENVRAMPGSVPRNGLAPSGGYVYRGLGYDQLNPGPSIAGLRKRGALPADFKPYIYGAALGTPSKGRPERVLAAIEAGVTEADRRPRPQPVPASAGPEPGPVRCERCGYLVTAPGHLIECGGAS